MSQLNEYGTKISDVARQYLLPELQPSSLEENAIDNTFRQLLLQKMNMAMNLNDDGNWRNSSFSSYDLSSFASLMQQMFGSTGMASFTPSTLLPSYDQAISSYNKQEVIENATIPKNIKNKMTNASREEINAIVREAAQKYNVDEKLIHSIIKMESNYNPNVVSHAGAVGLMQLMPAAAREVGVTDRYDIRQNIFGGTAYFSNMLKRHNNDIRIALAAYNAGPGNVKKYGGVPPFKETQNYVRKVLNHYLS